MFLKKEEAIFRKFMKILKKITLFTLLIALMLSFTGCDLFGSSNIDTGPKEGEPEYYILNDELVKPSQNSLFRYKVFENYVSISEYIGEETNVTIPDEIEGLPVYVIEDATFEYNKTISSVVMSDNVVKIGTNVFYFCPLLKTVKLSKNLTTIPQNAFDSCTSLDDIKLPDSLTSISTYAFNNRTSLSSIIIPSAVETVDSSAFYGCSNLKKAVFMDGVIADEESNYVKTVYKTLGVGIFSQCMSLETILVPDSVINIDDMTFAQLSDNVVIYGYVPSSVSNHCATQKINFIEVVEGDDKDRQMKDRSIVVPETETKPETK
jgi:hypothetical protein